MSNVRKAKHGGLLTAVFSVVSSSATDRLRCLTQSLLSAWKIISAVLRKSSSRRHSDILCSLRSARYL